MFSKTWLIGVAASLLLQYAPQLEIWAAAAVSWLIGALLAWARNHAVKTGTLANPLTGTKKAAAGVWK